MDKNIIDAALELRELGATTATAAMRLAEGMALLVVFQRNANACAKLACEQAIAHGSRPGVSDAIRVSRDAASASDRDFKNQCVKVANARRGYFEAREAFEAKVADLCSNAQIL